MKRIHHPCAAPSLDRVYREHADFVWHLLRHLGAADRNRDDLFHEVFLRVHRRLPEQDGRSSLPTWLFAITRDVVVSHPRRATPAPTDRARSDGASLSADARIAAWSRLQAAIHADALHEALAAHEPRDSDRRRPWSLVVLAAAALTVLITGLRARPG